MEEQRELTIIDNSLEVFKGGSEILHKNQKRAEVAVEKANALIAEWKAAFAEPDPEKKKQLLFDLDVRSNKFLVLCRDVKVKAFQERTAITSLMDEIKSMFTSSENTLEVTKGGPVGEVQARRNEFAKWKKAEDDRIAKEAEAKRNKADEATNLKAAWLKYINETLINIISEKKKKITIAFNGITLETFEDKSSALKKMPTAFKREELKIVLPPFRHAYHNQSEIEELQKQVRGTYNFEEFYADFEDQISALKDELIDKLPSKKIELDEAERLRLQAIEDQKEHERKMKKAKDEQERIRLENEAAENKRKLQEEQDRLEREKKLREEEEAIALEREQQNKLKESNDKVEAVVAGEHAASMFDQVLSNTDNTPAPASKDTMDVTVTHVAGWVLLFEFWFKNEGVNTKPEEAMDLDSKKFESLRKFAAKMAKKGNKIDSPYIVYESGVKAVNKKERKPKETA